MGGVILGLRRIVIRRFVVIPMSLLLGVDIRIQMQIEMKMARRYETTHILPVGNH